MKISPRGQEEGAGIDPDVICVGFLPFCVSVGFLPLCEWVLCYGFMYPQLGIKRIRKGIGIGIIYVHIRFL